MQNTNFSKNPRIIILKDLPNPHMDYMRVVFTNFSFITRNYLLNNSVTILLYI